MEEIKNGVSMFAIATSGKKGECKKTFGRISFSKDAKKVVKACEETLKNFETWAANLKALKAEAEKAAVIQEKEAVQKVLEGYTVEQLKAEIARRNS
jgi:hypothetical protein